MGNKTKSNAKKAKNKKKNSKPVEEEEEEDERFAAAHNRPQFRVSSSSSSSKNQKSSPTNKIVLDERFSSVLTDPRFQLQEKDKYGRKGEKSKQRSKNELEAFYTVAEETEDHQEQKEASAANDDASTASSSSSSSNDSDRNDNQRQQDEDPASRISYLTALSRGELDVSSSSSSDDDASDDDNSSDDDSSVEGEDPIHGTAGILDPSKQQQEDIELTHDQSPYLAVTNLDWTHVRAMDIFAILSSFAPPGSVKRVSVYLSDFGKEKMAHEMQHGPPSLWKKKKDKKKQQSTNKDDGEDDMEEEDDSSKEDSEEHDNDNDDDDREVVDYEGMDEQAYADFLQSVKEDQMPTDSDFDPEKLRAYEASKLKYYFAVAEFDNAAAADVAYDQVDGMEFEHSSAAVDMRSIPADAVNDVVKDRELRDQASSLPGNYVPPEFIVSALQQTNVQCTWEAGDSNRERMLTKYSSAEQWASMAENDDLKAYLASDGSSEEEDNDDSDNDSDAPNAKGAKLRKLLGLDADSDDEEEGDAIGKEEQSSDEDDDKEVSKEIRYTPGKVDLQEKIRTKLETKKEDEQKLTPWEKYQQKRKEKRKERRQAARRKRSDIEMEGKAPKQRQSDSFFMEETADSDGDHEGKHKPSKEELELLLAGDNDEEVAKDFDMRGLRRIDKNKGKKLSKSRKRKEEKLAASVSGQDFAIDLKDSRFAAVLDGDDGRFGIDRTDPQYKETPAMREILDEQRARRKKKRKKNPAKVVPPNVVEGKGLKNSGASALSSLVKSLKKKVATNKL